MPRFESHITVHKEYQMRVGELANEQGWKFSVITGCPLLGPDTYCYLTGYDTDANKLDARVEATAKLLEAEGIPVLRTKIERVVKDSKTGVDELSDVKRYEEAIQAGVRLVTELMKNGPPKLPPVTFHNDDYEARERQ